MLDTGIGINNIHFVKYLPMALIKSVRNFTPQIGDNCFLAENTTIIGDVKIGTNCSFWFNSVIRGDVNSISIGNNVNVQDGACSSLFIWKSKITIGNNISIGHNVIVHGATIEDNVLIGMGAIIMDHAIIGKNSIIAAGAIVLDSTIVEPGSIYGGVPAKRIKSVDQKQTKEMIEKIANNYKMYASWYK